jgi:hypothetical protein
MRFVNPWRQNDGKGTAFHSGGARRLVAIARNPEPTKPVDVLPRVAGRSVRARAMLRIARIPDFVALAPVLSLFAVEA